MKLRLKTILPFVIIGFIYGPLVVASSEDSAGVLCGERSTFPIGNEIFPINAVLQCDGHGDNIQAMCQCMEETFGDSIKDSEEYRQFNSQLIEFDQNSNAMLEFTQNIETMEMATMINFLSESMEGETSPFDLGGVCGQKFQDYQNQINNSLEVNVELGPITDFFYGQKDYNYLSSEGLTSEVLETGLRDFWQVNTIEGLGQVLEPRYDVENRFLNYVYGTAGLRSNGQNLIERAQATFSGNTTEPFAALSKTSAIESLCDGLVERFDEMRLENQVYKAPGDFIDRENLLTDSSLTLMHLPAYRGLEQSYLEANGDNSVRDRLYFNQRLCVFMPEENRTPEVSRPDNTGVHGLTDEELIGNITRYNDALERVSEEVEAGESRLDEISNQLREVQTTLEEVLPAYGVTFAQFEEALGRAGENPDPVAVLEQLMGEREIAAEDQEELFRIFTLAQHYHVLDSELEEVAIEVSYIHASIHHMQSTINDSFQELAHRYGGINSAVDLIGSEEFLSRTSSYYARVYEDRSSDYIGPRLGHHHMMGGLIGNVRGIGTEIVRRANELTRIQGNTETVVNEVRRTMEGEFEGKLPEEGRGAFDSILASRYSSQRTGGRSSQQRIRRKTRVSDAIAGRNILGQASVFSGSSLPTSFRERQGQQQKTSASGQVRAPASSSLKTPSTSGTSAFDARLNPNSQGPGANLLAPSRGESGPSRPLETQEQVDRSIAELERRIAELDRRNRFITAPGEGVVTEISDEPDTNSALRNEVSSLKSSLESLRERSRLLGAREEKLQEAALSETASPRPVQGPSAQSGAPRASQTIRSGTTARPSASAVAPTAEATPASVAQAPGIVPVSSGAGSASGPRIEVPYSGSGGASGDGSVTSEAGSFPELNLTLINGSVGFAEVNPNQLSVAPVEVGLDFLSLSEVGKVEFIESFFSERTGESAVIRQRDGRVVVIERSRDFNPAASEEEIRQLEGEELLRNQAETVHRVRTMNLTLDRIFEQ